MVRTAAGERQPVPASCTWRPRWATIAEMNRSRVQFPVSSVALVAAAIVVGSGCGGGNKPAESAMHEKSSSESSGESGAAGEKGKGGSEKGNTAKKESKYPPPFMEPDCASPAAEGYLADAKKIVAEVRRTHWDQLKACADAAPDGEKVSGEIRTSFRLDPDGVPRCVEAPGSSMANQEVINCVIGVYRKFRFAKGPKNGSIRVTDGIKLDVTDDDDD